MKFCVYEMVSMCTRNNGFSFFFFFLVKSLLVYESTKLILSTTREMNLDHWLLLDYLLTLMIVDVLQLGHRFDVASDY